MKAILKYSLYRRPQPTNEVAAAGFLAKDSVIEVEAIVPGKAIDNISLWYKANDGFYYWSGGIQKLQAIGATKFNFSVDPFHTLINYNIAAFNTIPQNVRDTKGKGVRIAIIDTGMNQKHASFQSDDIKVVSDFTSSAAGTNDINGHGSHVAGLIGGRLQSATGITGIAPLSELFILKGIDDDGSTSAQNLNKAIKEAIDLNVQIINLSLDIAPLRYSTIESEINRALSKGIIIVAAAGENDGLKINNTLLCPADKEGIVAIGSCDESNIQNPQMFQKKINFIIPNYFFWSCFNENKIFSKERGSSMATALVTGIVALILSSSPNGDKGFVLASLNKYALSFSDFKSGDICLLNPSK